MSDVSRTELRPEYAELARALVARLRDSRVGDRTRSVVAVAGESGSGKSVTATSLARALDAAGSHAIVLHQDDYFHIPPRANHAAREHDIGRVGPGEVNLALLQSHIAAFHDARDGVDAPFTSYEDDRFAMKRISFVGVHVLVVEGTYVLGLDDIDVRLFLEATYTDTLPRRRDRARDVDSPFVERVLAIEHRIIARQAASADLLIDANFAIRDNTV